VVLAIERDDRHLNAQGLVVIKAPGIDRITLRMIARPSEDMDPTFRAELVARVAGPELIKRYGAVIGGEIELVILNRAMKDALFRTDRAIAVDPPVERFGFNNLESNVAAVATALVGWHHEHSSRFPHQLSPQRKLGLMPTKQPSATTAKMKHIRSHARHGKSTSFRWRDG
jgi:hypothetical protein